MSFKDFIAADAAVFINPDEFAEKHNLDGRDIDIVIDDDELQRRKLKATNPEDGIYSAVLLFYAMKSDFAARPVIGKPLKLDNRIYRINDVQVDDPVMYTITLERNGS
jgi:hypothetical protein